MYIIVNFFKGFIFTNPHDHVQLLFFNTKGATFIRLYIMAHKFK